MLGAFFSNKFFNLIRKKYGQQAEIVNRFRLRDVTKLYSVYRKLSGIPTPDANMDEKRKFPTYIRFCFLVLL
uniref:Uncharacterized protein n=1 Tax=Onchocerca volvulus TaxID=6282 RepID=A0A8R1XTC3_ONCVO